MKKQWLFVVTGLLLLSACGWGNSIPPIKSEEVPQEVQQDTFTTEALPSSILSSVPAASATGIARNTSITFKFQNAMNRSSVETAFALSQGRYNTATNPATFTKLLLTSVCNGQWKVKNPNNVAISFNWDIGTATEKGLGVVPANSEVNFYSSAGKKVRVLVGTQLQANVVSSTSACGVKPWSVTWSADSKSVTFKPSSDLVDQDDYTYALSTFAKTSSNVALSSVATVSFDTYPSGGIRQITGTTLPNIEYIPKPEYYSNSDPSMMGFPISTSISIITISNSAQYPTQSEKNVWNSLNSGAIRYHFMSSSIPTRVVLC